MKTLTAVATALALITFANAAFAMCEGSSSASVPTEQETAEDPILLPEDSATS